MMKFETLRDHNGLNVIAWQVHNYLFFPFPLAWLSLFKKKNLSNMASRRK